MQKLNNIKAVIFDCDGVMFETRGVNAKYYNLILKHFNKREMTKEEADYSQMHTVSESLYYLFKGENIKEVLEYKKEIEKDKYALIKEMPIEPDLISILKKIRKKSIKTAIATNRSDTMPEVLKEHNLENLFDLTITADDVENPKPAPDPLLKVLDSFKLSPKEAVFIGDSFLDERAAFNAEVAFVAFNNRELKSNYHINSLKSIEEILEI